jgi:lipid II:glycine glycyltransferase (peptidoglycan interpeptide bridge formation enzyme)
MDHKRWNEISGSFQNSSILQTWEWGEMKKSTGWRPDFYVRQDEKGSILAASLILTREQKISRFGPVFRVIYLPHGPMLDWLNENLVLSVLADLTEYARRHKANYIKIDPQVVPQTNRLNGLPIRCEISENSISALKNAGWQYSLQQIQFKNSFWIDLSPTEEQLMAEMKQKTRYNIRLSERKGVEVKEGVYSDLELLYEMYLETSTRDGFIIRPKSYYLEVWGRFIQSEKATPLVAYYEDAPIAALMLFHFAGKSYYLYGMSSERRREMMPNYLLQWEAIKLSKRLGCRVYDLWGAPDVMDESDRMWGVYRFKDGLGGKIIETIGAYDYPTSRFTYTIIQKGLPIVQRMTRWLRRRQMLEELEQS